MVADALRFLDGRGEHRQSKRIPGGRKHPAIKCSTGARGKGKREQRSPPSLEFRQLRADNLQAGSTPERVGKRLPLHVREAPRLPITIHEQQACLNFSPSVKFSLSPIRITPSLSFPSPPDPFRRC